jgi:IS5 family transposase
MSRSSRGKIPVGSRPFHSKLSPYFDLIASSRRRKKTWAEIAWEISARGTKCTPQAVFIFFKRCKTREQERGSRYPLGMEPEGSVSGFPAMAHTEAARSPVMNGSETFEKIVDEAEERTRQQHRERPVPIVKPEPGTKL